MKKGLHKAVLMALLMGSVALQAQFKPGDLRVSLLNEGTLMPSYRVISTPVHPGIMLGTDVRSRSGEHWQRDLAIDMGYYYHKRSEHALMLGVTWFLSYQLQMGLAPKILLGTAYKHSFVPGPVYKLEGSEYIKKAHPGQSQFAIKMGVGIDFQINEQYVLTSEYYSLIATPYVSLPFSLHSLFSVGVKINFIHAQ